MQLWRLTGSKIYGQQRPKRANGVSSSPIAGRLDLGRADVSV